MPSTSNNAFSVQMDREHQSTISPEGKPHLSKKKLFNVVLISVLTKSTAINDLIIYLHHTNVNWYWRYHIVGLHVKKCRKWWWAAASCWREPSPLTPELHQLVSKSFSLLGSGWRELCNHHDALPTCWARLALVGPQLRGCLAGRPGHTLENVPVL